MKLLTCTLSLHLPRRATMRLDAARGASIEVRAGMLWLTEEGLAKDVFLREGERCLLGTDGRVIVQAESDSAFELRGAVPRPAPISLRSPRPSRPARVAGASGFFRSRFSALLRTAPHAGI
jgi:hypothetical protein